MKQDTNKPLYDKDGDYIGGGYFEPHYWYNSDNDTKG